MVCQRGGMYRLQVAGRNYPGAAFLAELRTLNNDKWNIMRRTNKLLLFSLLLITLQWQCVQKYNSPYVSPPTGYLVVEGYISGNSPTQYTLSRTIPLPGDSAIPMETGARVQVEGTDNSIYPLTEQSAGTYVADTLTLS